MINLFGPYFSFGMILTTLLLLVGHWAPWPRRLGRICAYIYGTASILAGVGLWLCLFGMWDVWLGMVAVALVGGLAVIAAYQIDRAVQLIRMGWKAEIMAERMLDDGDAE